MNRRGDLLSRTGVFVLSVLLLGLFILGVQYVGAGGSATIGGNSFTIYQCGELNASGVYYLNQSISNGTSDCLTIRADGITIDGNGSTISGIINATNSTATRAHTDLVIQNLTLNGSIISRGPANSTGVGFSSGSINVTNSNISISIVSVSVDATSNNASNTGPIFITNSNVTLINSSAGDATGNTGGSAGNISILNSVIGNIYTKGGRSGAVSTGGSSAIVNLTYSIVGSVMSVGSICNGPQHRCLETGAINVYQSNVSLLNASGNWGGSATGPITVISSNVTNIISAGYSFNGDSGNVSGLINVTNSQVDSIISVGGGSSSSGVAFDSGPINILSSTVRIINSTGGQAFQLSDSGGNAGLITIVNSNVTNILSRGGTCNLAACPSSGSASNVTLINSNLNISNVNIVLLPGNATTKGRNGTLFINNSFIFNSYGGIRFNYVSSNKTNLSSIILISNNSISVNSSYSDYNVSANVTIYNVPNGNGYLINKMLRNDVECNSTTSPRCNNLTALYGSSVVFNVSGWSNYSIYTYSDSIAPVVTLSAPSAGSGYSGSSYTVPFVYDASDSGIGIANCSVYANGVGYANTSAIAALSNSQNISLSAGIYNAYVNCTDFYGNTGNSSNITFTITTPAVESTSLPLGASSSSTDSQLTEGVTRILTAGDQLRFSILSDANAGTEWHSLRVNNVYSNYVMITLYSSPIRLNLSVGETKQADLNGNGKNDISVTLNKIVFGRAELYIKKIVENAVPAVNNETIVVPEANPIPVEKGISLNGIIKVVLFVVIIAIIIVGVLLYRSLKFRRVIRGVKIREGSRGKY